MMSEYECKICGRKEDTDYLVYPRAAKIGRCEMCYLLGLDELRKAMITDGMMQFVNNAGADGISIIPTSQWMDKRMYDEKINGKMERKRW